MNLSLLAAALLLLWLLMPCLLGPAALSRLYPPGDPPRIEQTQPTSDILARLYRRPPLGGSPFSVPGSQSQKSERPRPMTRPAI